MPNKRLTLVVPPDVYARLCDTALQMGLKPNTLAARVIETADANGDYDIAKNIEFECPFSPDRLRQLRFFEQCSLLAIGEYAKEVMEWETAPRPAQVRAWIENFGFTAGRDKLAASHITARTRAADPTVPEGQHRCPDCLEVKPIEGGYYKDINRPSGHSTYCRDCTAKRRSPAKMRQWYERNREKQIEASRVNKAKRKSQQETISLVEITSIESELIK